MIIQAFKVLARAAIRHPQRMLLLAALATLAAAPGVARLKLRTDGQALISPTAPEVVTDKHIRADFGLHDQMVVWIRPRDAQDIFNPATLQLVRDLTAAFKGVSGVGPENVVSLATEPSFRLRPGTLNHQTMLEPRLKSAAELAQLRDDLRRIQLYNGTFVALDGKSTVILVGVPNGEDRAQFYQQARQIIAAHAAPTEEIALTGAPVAESMFGLYILEDLGVPGVLLGDVAQGVAGRAERHWPASLLGWRVWVARHVGLVPLAALVMVLVLLVCFRNLLAALLPLPGAAATMLFVFGCMGWLAVPIYLTTAVMPVLLTVISVTNDIYLFSRYFTLLRERPGANHLALLEETFDKLARPVACTSFAAVAGFLSFGFSPLAPVKAFGIFTGVGVLFGLWLSFTVVPSLLALVKPQWLRGREANGEKSGLPSNPRSPLAAGFAGVGRLVVRHRWWVISGTLAALGLTPLGLRRLVVQDSWTNGFDPNSEFRQVTQAVNDSFFGMHLLFICASAPKTIQGEAPLAALSGSELTMPANAAWDPMLIAGSPIRLAAGPAQTTAAVGGENSAPDDPTWQSHVEMVNHNGGSVYARLARPGPGTNFEAALARSGRVEYEIAVRTHYQPELIRTLGDLGAFIRAQRQDAVGGVLGPADYLATTRFLARPDDPAARVLPADAAETKLMWDYYALALGPRRLRQLVDTNYWQSLTTVFFKDANFVGTADLMARVRDYERARLAPQGISVSFAGDVAVSQSLIRGIVSTQLQSLGWSLLGIFAVTALLGGSWRWGICCLLPSLLAVVIKFAVMGWANIPLGVATSMFAAMTLGIGVNCAIHVLEGFDQARTAGQPPQAALSQALSLSGPPAFINSLAISLGFGVLLLSQVPANARLGLLLVLGLVNCFVFSMVLLPLLLCRDTPKN